MRSVIAVTWNPRIRGDIVSSPVVGVCKPRTGRPASHQCRRTPHRHWYESMSRTPIRDGCLPSRPLVSSCRRPLESPRTRHSGPPNRHSRESRNPEGRCGCGNDTRTLPPTNASNFHTLVCRRQPAWAIGTKIGGSRRIAPQFVILAEAGIQRGRVAPTTPKHLQRPSPIFIPWCAGARRHERLARKHVPDSDPGCALQSTSMPAPHGRNVPNCRPMADGGMRKCSAVEDFARRGACPPQGSGWGLAESTVPIRCTKPQLQLFIS